MKNSAWFALVVLCFVCVLHSPATKAQSSDENRWWPSEWGSDDERGAANRMTPMRIVEAARLIREGIVYSLGRDYEHGMPGFGNRHFSLTIPGRPTGGPMGENHRNPMPAAVRNAGPI